MRLVRFAVRGFKNLVNEVVLDELGPFEVLHGENNVGKSNLLQAIDLFFALMESLALQMDVAGGSLARGRAVQRDED